MAVLEHLEQTVGPKAVGAVSSAGVYGGSAVSLLAWLGSQSAVAIVGIVVSIGGLILSWWHKRAMQRIARDRLALDRARFEADLD